MPSLNHRLQQPLVTLVTAFCSLLIASSVQADVIIDDFESQTVPSGDPAGYFSFGNQLSDRGVSAAFGATSGSNSAFYVINFSVDANDAFGVGAAHERLSLALDPNQFVSVQIRIHEGLVSGGFIGFRIEDKDGTVMRTDDTQLFAANSTFQPISQSLASLSHTDFDGVTAGFDYTQIDSVGLLFFDRSFSGTTTVVFDDLKITAVPEPSSGLLMTAALAIATSFARRRRINAAYFARPLRMAINPNTINTPPPI